MSVAEDDDNLWQALVDAKLAGTKGSDGYHFNTNEQAADAAIKVMAAWLRRKAYRQRVNAQAFRASPSHREACERAAQRLDIMAEKVLGTYDPARGPEVIREVL